jgi:hypothetical protein
MSVQQLSQRTLVVLELVHSSSVGPLALKPHMLEVHMLEQPLSRTHTLEVVHSSSAEPLVRGMCKLVRLSRTHMGMCKPERLSRTHTLEVVYSSSAEPLVRGMRKLERLTRTSSEIAHKLEPPSLSRRWVQLWCMQACALHRLERQRFHRQLAKPLRKFALA